MTTDDLPVRPSRLFTVRVWTEAMVDVVEHRGSVRDVETGAFRNFREWSDLADFLVAQVKEDRLMNKETA
jgi:hypothetical protein